MSTPSATSFSLDSPPQIAGNKNLFTVNPLNVNNLPTTTHHSTLVEYNSLTFSCGGICLCHSTINTLKRAREAEDEST